MEIIYFTWLKKILKLFCTFLLVNKILLFQFTQFSKIKNGNEITIFVMNTNFQEIPIWKLFKF